jgi:hypothetical protein
MCTYKARCALIALLLTLPLASLEAATSDPVASEHSISASAAVRLNNDNWHTTPHPTPETFFVTPEREIFGTTTNGIPFAQVNVPNAVGVRVQKFIIQDHWHFIVAGRIVYADEDLQAAILEHHTASLLPRSVERKIARR